MINHQDALMPIGFILKPDIDMNSVHPEIDIVLAHQVTLVPCLVFGRPFLLEPHDRVGTQVLDRLAEDRLKRRRKVSGGNAL